VVRGRGEAGGGGAEEECDQIVVFKTPGLHCRSPSSGELPYTLKGSTKMIWTHSEGWWVCTGPWSEEENLRVVEAQKVHGNRWAEIAKLVPSHTPRPLHGGQRGFRPPQILGCYVTKSASHQALKLITRSKLTFDSRVVVHSMERLKPCTGTAGRKSSSWSSPHLVSTTVSMNCFWHTAIYCTDAVLSLV
jgi:hypothetical protein